MFVVGVVKRAMRCVHGPSTTRKSLAICPLCWGTLGALGLVIFSSWAQLTFTLANLEGISVFGKFLDFLIVKLYINMKMVIVKNLSQLILTLNLKFSHCLVKIVVLRVAKGSEEKKN